jgi:hypothetical protein
MTQQIIKMTNSNSIQKTEENNNALLTKDPVEQLKDFKIFAKQYALQSKSDQSSEVATTSCPAHYKSGIIERYGYTPLINAIIKNDNATFEHYIKICTDIKESGVSGATPLHWTQ